MQKLYSIFVRIIRNTVNACLVIVSYKEKHTTDRTEIVNLESKVAFNFLPIIRYTVNVNLVIVSYKEKHESGIRTGTIHREFYGRSKVKRSGCCLRRLNDSANETRVLDEARSFICSESGESRWKVAG